MLHEETVAYELLYAGLDAEQQAFYDDLAEAGVLPRRGAGPDAALYARRPRPPRLVSVPEMRPRRRLPVVPERPHLRRPLAVPPVLQGDGPAPAVPRLPASLESRHAAGLAPTVPLEHQSRHRTARSS